MITTGVETGFEVTFYRQRVAEVSAKTRTCTGVSSIRIADERLSEIAETVSTDYSLSYADKKTLKKEIYLERRRLPEIKLPGARRNTFLLPEQQLFKNINTVSSVAELNPVRVTRMINDCIVDGVPDARRLAKLQRVAVYNRSDDVRMEKLTRLYLADIITTRVFFEAKNSYGL
ncbi:MAG: hypothetical protein FWC00_03420 [Firmicutes bacterium]|nr:hypothetical protein [Bacillota bacterium]